MWKEEVYLTWDSSGWKAQTAWCQRPGKELMAVPWHDRKTDRETAVCIGESRQEAPGVHNNLPLWNGITLREVEPLWLNLSTTRLHLLKIPPPQHCPKDIKIPVLKPWEVVKSDGDKELFGEGLWGAEVCRRKLRGSSVGVECISTDCNQIKLLKMLFQNQEGPKNHWESVNPKGPWWSFLIAVKNLANHCYSSKHPAKMQKALRGDQDTPRRRWRRQTNKRDGPKGRFFPCEDLVIELLHIYWTNWHAKPERLH